MGGWIYVPRLARGALGLGLAAVIGGGCGGSHSVTTQTARVTRTQAAGTPGPGTPPTRDRDHQLIPGGGFVGSWSGTVNQHGPGGHSSTFPLTVRVNARPGPNGIGKVIYPGGCSGDISVDAAKLTRLGYYAYPLVEDFLTGCRSGAFVLATPLGNEMLWQWSRDKTNIIGTLQRASSPHPSASSVFASAGNAVTGRWAGTAVQYGPGSQKDNFSVVMGLGSVAGLSPAGRDATANVKPGWDGFIRYPSDHCEAQVFFAGTFGDSLRYTEQVASGDCVRGGIIDMRPFGNVMLWRWHGSYRGAPIDSWAILQHTNGDPLAPNDVAREGNR